MQSNIIGAYNIWEAAHLNGVKRVVYASSVHALGIHLKTDTIGLDAPHKPDSYYGLAKCFAEDFAHDVFAKTPHLDNKDMANLALVDHSQP